MMMMMYYECKDSAIIRLYFCTSGS